MDFYWTQNYENQPGNIPEGRSRNVTTSVKAAHKGNVELQFEPESSEKGHIDTNFICSLCHASLLFLPNQKRLDKSYSLRIFIRKCKTVFSATVKAGSNPNVHQQENE